MELAQVTTDPSKDYGITFARNLYNASLPATITNGAGQQVSNPALIASDALYLVARIGSMVDSWAQQADLIAPAPAPAPGVINGVPQEVSRRQARQALALAGKLPLVQGCINAIPDPVQRELVQIEWDDSQVFLRQRPTLVALALSPAPYGLAMTAAQLDAIFVQAAAL